MSRCVITGGASWVFAGWEDGDALRVHFIDQDYGKVRAVVFDHEDQALETLAELNVLYPERKRSRFDRFKIVTLPPPSIIVDIDGEPLHRKQCWWLHENRAEEVRASARPDLPVPEVHVSYEGEANVEGEDEPQHWSSFIKVNRPAVRVGDSGFVAAGA